METIAVVLAGGMGKRMGRSEPKALIPVHGKPLLTWVTEASLKAGLKTCWILGKDLAPYENLMKAFPDVGIAIQEKALGTGAALASTAPFFGAPALSYGSYCLKREVVHKGDALWVLPCDVPGVWPSLLSDVESYARKTQACGVVVGMVPPENYGYGRLVHDGEGHLQRIVEEKDASPEEKLIPLCFSGLMWIKTSILFELLPLLTSQNRQGEYYMTDLMELMGQRGKSLKLWNTGIEGGIKLSGLNTAQDISIWEKRKQS